MTLILHCLSVTLEEISFLLSYVIPYLLIYSLLILSLRCELFLPMVKSTEKCQVSVTLWAGRPRVYDSLLKINSNYAAEATAIPGMAAEAARF